MVKRRYGQFRQAIDIAGGDQDLLDGDTLGSEQSAHKHDMVFAIAELVRKHGHWRVGGYAAGSQPHMDVSNISLDPRIDGGGLRPLVLDAFGDAVRERLDVGIYAIRILHS